MDAIVVRPGRAFVGGAKISPSPRGLTVEEAERLGWLTIVARHEDGSVTAHLTPTGGPCACVGPIIIGSHHCPCGIAHRSRYLGDDERGFPLFEPADLAEREEDPVGQSESTELFDGVPGDYPGYGSIRPSTEEERVDEPATCSHEWVPNGILWFVDDGTRVLTRFFRCLRCGEEREKRANGACLCIGSEEPGFPYCECGLPLAEA